MVDQAAESSNQPMAETPGLKSLVIRVCRKEMVGKVGITVSPANPDRVWAIVEAEDGGVFRSDNAGHTWTKDK